MINIFMMVNLQLNKMKYPWHPVAAQFAIYSRRRDHLFDNSQGSPGILDPPRYMFEFREEPVVMSELYLGIQGVQTKIKWDI